MTSQVLTSLIGAIITSIVLYVMLAKNEPVTDNFDVNDGSKMTVDDFKLFNTTWHEVYDNLPDHTPAKKNFLLRFVYLLNLMIWEKFSDDQKAQMTAELCQYFGLTSKELGEIINDDLKRIPPSSNRFDDTGYIESGFMLIFDIIYSYPEPDGIHVEDWIASQVDLYTLEEGLKALELVRSNKALPQR